MHYLLFYRGTSWIDKNDFVKFTFTVFAEFFGN